MINQSLRPSTMSPAIKPRCAVIGVVGRASVGKSSLVNALVGEKVSIVSPVAQTTRNTVRGILTERRGQLVFVDTPGMHKAESRLGTLMNRMARQAAANVDVLLVVFDGATPPEIEDEGWMRRALFAEQPTLFFLNKSDRLPFFADAYRARWEAVQKEKQTTREIHCWAGSATADAGLRELKEALFALAAPAEALLYPADVVSDFPRRLAIADVIREKLFAKLFEELPHEIGVRVDDLRESGAAWQVAATILVNRPSQKAIVLGPKGRTLRAAQRAATAEISALFEVEAELELWIKVEPKWTQNFWHLRQMGYLGEM